MNWILPLLLLIASLTAPAQTPETSPPPTEVPAERLAFDAALRTLEGGFTEQAAQDFAAFAQAHPNSPLLPQAVLLETRARSQIGQLDPAAQILTERLPQLGSVRDQALQLLGEIHLRRQRFPEAAAAFRQLIDEFPQSSLVLTASFHEALAHFRDSQFPLTIELLSIPTQAFPQSAATQPNDELSVRGPLLLAEAQLRSGLTDAAKTTLSTLADRPLTPVRAWDRQWLITSLALTNRQPDVALSAATELLTLATNAASRDLLARSHLAHAETLRLANRLGDAFASLTNNASDSTPSIWRRESLLTLAQLPLAPAQLEPALALLQPLATGDAADADAQIARLVIAELHLQKAFQGTTPPTSETLAPLIAQLRTVLSQSPSPLVAGRAWLGIGWAETAAGRLPEAAEAFTQATPLLAGSPLEALAIFKLADTLHQAGRHADALTQYLRVREFGTGPQPSLRGAPLERALYQGALAALEAGQPVVANELAGQAVVQFPNGEFRDDTRVLFGQTLARLDPPDRARDALQSLASRLTNSPALPGVQLAVARSYLREGNWSQALAQLDDWTRSHPNHTGIARAEFERAWATFKSGNAAGAYPLFTNYLGRFPDHLTAPQAQAWVGDHLLRTGQFAAAEAAYQLLFQRTNWPVTPLTFEARLLAGRAAFLRQGYRDAKTYFRWLIQNGPPAVTNSPIPSNLVARAYFAFGDCLVLEPEANPPLADAMTAFDRVIQLFPQSPEALLARGRLADCHLQRATLDTANAANDYQAAADLYLALIAVPDADISTRSQAEVQLGLVRERQAAAAPDPERPELLRQALAHRLRVLHGANLRPNESVAPFWVHRAGLEAARLAESLGQLDEAVQTYERLAQSFPAAATSLRQRAAQVRPRP